MIRNNNDLPIAAANLWTVMCVFRLPQPDIDSVIRETIFARPVAFLTLHEHRRSQGPRDWIRIERARRRRVEGGWLHSEGRPPKNRRLQQYVFAYVVKFGINDMA